MNLRDAIKRLLVLRWIASLDRRGWAALLVFSLWLILAGSCLVYLATKGPRP